MNAHILQSNTAIEEARVLFHAGHTIVSTQSGMPCNGLVQDTLNGLYLLTRAWPTKDDGECKTLRLSKATFFWIVTCMEIPLTRMYDTLRRAHRYYPHHIQLSPDGYPRLKGSTIPSSILVSLLFPPNLQYKAKTDNHKEQPVVKIRHGILMPHSGPICRKLVGTGGSLLHWIWHRHSSHEAMVFASLAEHMVYYWLAHHGLSIGPSDCLLMSNEGRDRSLAKMRAKYNAVLTETHRSPAEREAAIDAILNSTTNTDMSLLVQAQIQKGVQNTFNICEKSGAKGSVINLIQSSCLIGQQTINNGRVPLACSRQKRTLPCYTLDETSPESRGYIIHNYMEGLSPQDSFFHAMAGRKGLISTGIKTSDTGYIQKCMSRKMEDLVVQLDGSVRDANNCIIDPFYGGDGLDSRRCVKTQYGTMAVDITRLAHTLNESCVQWCEHRQKLILACGDHNVAPMTEEEIAMALTMIRPCHSGIETTSTRLATELLHAKLRQALKETPICRTRKAELIVEIKQAVEAGMVAYGTNVGLVASSSMGSPVAQATLKYFQLAGVKNRDTASGVARIKETLYVTKTKDLKKPSCMVYPSPEIQARIVDRMQTAKLSDDPQVRSNARLYAVSQLQALRFALQYLELKDITESMTMLRTHEKVSSSSIGLVTYPIYEVPWWMSMARQLQNLDPWDPTKVSWVVRIQCKRHHIYQHMTLTEIASKLSKVSGGLYEVMVSPDALGQLHLLVKDADVQSYQHHIPSQVSFMTVERMSYYFTKSVLLPYLESCQLSGLESLKRVAPMEDPKTGEWYLDVSCQPKVMTLKRSMHQYMKLLNRGDVDRTRTVFEDLHTLTEILGIEAAQEYFINEVCRVLNYDADRRHIDLLARSMTYTGKFKAATRHGIYQTNQPFARILFETHVDQAMLAAFQNEHDPGTGFAVSMMLGTQASRIGTGTVRVRAQ